MHSHSMSLINLTIIILLVYLIPISIKPPYPITSIELIHKIKPFMTKSVRFPLLLRIQVVVSCQLSILIPINLSRDTIASQSQAEMLLDRSHLIMYRGEIQIDKIAYRISYQSSRLKDRDIVAAREAL